MNILIEWLKSKLTSSRFTTWLAGLIVVWVGNKFGIQLDPVKVAATVALIIGYLIAETKRPMGVSYDTAKQIVHKRAIAKAARRIVVRQ